MISGLRIVLQILTYAAFVFVVGYFSFWPRYEYASSGDAVIKISLSHATNRVKPCRTLTAEELAALAPNMRQPERCERERVPLTVELEIDGDTITTLQAAPFGIWNDGPSSVYQRFDLHPGRHRVVARLRDTAREDGWDYSKTEDIDIEAGRYMTITFKAETGGFIFR